MTKVVKKKNSASASLSWLFSCRLSYSVFPYNSDYNSPMELKICEHLDHEIYDELVQ